MRVYPKVDRTTEEQAGKWHHHMATRKHAHTIVNLSYSNRNFHSMQHSTQFTSTIPPRLHIMEASGNIRPTSSVFSPLPLNFTCPLDVVKLGIHTATGRWWNILCCIDLWTGIHYSQSFVEILNNLTHIQQRLSRSCTIAEYIHNT